MSEFELGVLRQRAQEAYRQKVMRGEVLTRVPIGFVRKGASGIEMTPDKEIQEAISNVFLQFDRFGTLRQALLWYHDEKVLFPAEHRRAGISRIEWQLPNYQQLLRVMKNPTYAGAFAWGRTGARSEMIDGRSRKTLGHSVPMEQWQVLIKDHHIGYIPWEKYMENKQTLESNKSRSHQKAGGAPKGGRALLAGLLRCAQCGHKLHVGYRGPDGRSPRYYCLTGNREQGKPSCLSFGGVKVENAVVDVVLRTCQPIAVEASLTVLAEANDGKDQKRKALELALERARYEAEHARRQYDAVDPDNRLVAAELEERWNAALLHAADTESRLASEQKVSATLTDDQHLRLLILGEDVDALWNDPASPMELKKRILRTVINEIIVDINHDSGHVEMQVHWVGGVHTPLRAAKNKFGVNRNATDKNIVELVRELATGWRDPYIASILNKAGYRTGKGNNWNETRVKNLRVGNKILPFSKSKERSWKTMTEAASILNVSIGTVRLMVTNKILPAKQFAKHTPWMIEKENLEKHEVQRYVKQTRSGRSAPCQDNTEPLNL
jgi:hypothetical protein